MKKFLSLAVAIGVCIGANAQFTQKLKDLDICNHLGAAVGVGTTGITIDLGTTITPWVQLRAGVDIMPEFKLNTTFGLTEYDNSSFDASYPRPQTTDIDAQGKLINTTGHFLFDVFPITHLTSVHITVGGYFGGSRLIKAYNTNGFEDLKDVYLYNHRDVITQNNPYAGVPMSQGRIGAELGDYFIEPDADGQVNASIKVWKFRPYVGIGFGRIVPKSRFNCLFDLGVQFWGSPQVWNDTDHQRLTESGMNGSDGGAIKLISKIGVYPVLSVKFVGKIL